MYAEQPKPVAESKEAADESPAGDQDRRDSNGDESLKSAAGGSAVGDQVRRDSNGDQKPLVRAAGQNQPEPVAKAAGGNTDDRWQMVLQGLTASLTEALDQGRPKTDPVARPKPIGQLQPMPLKINLNIETPSK